LPSLAAGAIVAAALYVSMTSAPVHAVGGMNLPASLGAVAVPADNPQTDAKVKLGHQLFFDKRLSVDGRARATRATPTRTATAARIRSRSAPATKY